MTSFLQALAARFRNRTDSEHGQALTRVVVTAVILVYLLGVTSTSEVSNEPLQLVFLFFAIEFVVGLGILAGIALRPGVSHPRRVLGMFLDYGMMGAAMHVLGESLAPVYVVLMWVTIGNGLRFGERYLVAAILIASASFLGVLLTTPYWQQNQMLGWGLLLGLSAIPAPEPCRPSLESPAMHIHILGICGTFMGGLAALAAPIARAQPVATVAAASPPCAPTPGMSNGRVGASSRTRAISAG